MEQEHKRRPRYKGTHPRTFQEKYKEHDPEKYRSDVEKIIESGKTPAGMHIPILVDEILEVLQIQPGQTGYDATLGYGGHTRRMLARLPGARTPICHGRGPHRDGKDPRPGWHLRASGRSSSPSSIGISPTWTRWPPACSSTSCWRI